MINHKFSLFTRKIDVLYINDRVAELARVSLSKTPNIIKHFRSQHNGLNILESLNLLFKNIKTKSVYLLLDQEYTYVVTFSIPLHIQGSEERLYVYRKLSELIPEVLEDKDWDYRESSQNVEDKNVVAFAIVKDRCSKIIEALQSIPIEVKAIEPEEISISRNQNPIIGMALKNDIYGRDNRSLNISISKKKLKNNYVVMFGWSIVAISFVTLTLLLDLVFRGWLY